MPPTILPRLLTFTGREVDLLTPSPDQVDLVDVAWSLAHQNRYLGHTQVPYSVGQHCVAMARAARAEGASPEIVAWCLLHDAAEAYLGDLVWPVTASGLGGDIRALEERWIAAIAEHCALSLPIPRAIKELDLECIEVEAELLLRPWTTQVAPRSCRPALRRAIAETVIGSAWPPEAALVAGRWASMVAPLVATGARPDVEALHPFRRYERGQRVHARALEMVTVQSSPPRPTQEQVDRAYGPRAWKVDDEG